MECISNGKAHKRYEFGCKVALAITSKGGWVLAARSLEGNPYDGHTLRGTMDRIVATSRAEPSVYCDMTTAATITRGCEIHVGRSRRGSIAKSVWRWMGRRAAIEPPHRPSQGGETDGEVPAQGDGGRQGQRAVLSAAAMNFSSSLRRSELRCLCLLGSLRALPLTRRVEPRAGCRVDFSVSTR